MNARQLTYCVFFRSYHQDREQQKERCSCSSHRIGLIGELFESWSFVVSSPGLDAERATDIADLRDVRAADCTLEWFLIMNLSRVGD